MMQEWKCRFSGALEWAVVSAASPQEAAHSFHWTHPGAPDVVIQHNGESVHFVLVEVAEQGTWVSRIYRAGITRRGGVARKQRWTIQDVAAKLGWKRPAEDLLLAGWELEEDSWQ